MMKLAKFLEARGYTSKISPDGRSGKQGREKEKGSQSTKPKKQNNKRDEGRKSDNRRKENEGREFESFIDGSDSETTIYQRAVDFHPDVNIENSEIMQCVDIPMGEKRISTSSEEESPNEMLQENDEETSLV